MRCADFVVKEPMVIGHEAAGVVAEVRIGAENRGCFFTAPGDKFFGTDTGLFFVFTCDGKGEYVRRGEAVLREKAVKHALDGALRALD